MVVQEDLQCSKVVLLVLEVLEVQQCLKVVLLVLEDQ